jgi:hypothetical protein
MSHSHKRSAVTAAVAAVILLPLASFATSSAATAATKTPAKAAGKAPKCPSVTVIAAGGDAASTKKFDGVGPAAYKVAGYIKSAAKKKNLTYKLIAEKTKTQPIKDLVPTTAERASYKTDPTTTLQTYGTTNVAKYVATVDTVATNIVGAMNLLSTSCPNSKVVLVGTAQGAMSIHSAEETLLADHSPEFIEVIGTFLISDGDMVANTKGTQLGTAAATAEGIRPALGLTDTDDPDPSTTNNLCNKGDILCDFVPATIFKSLAKARAAIKVHDGYVKVKKGKVSSIDKRLKKAAKKTGKKIHKPKIIFSGKPATHKPPKTLGGFKMTPFGPDSRAPGTAVTSVVDPAGTVGFSASVTLEDIGSGWATWSNGYKGSVYWSGEGVDAIALKLPPGTKAFYLYAEPNEFQDFTVSVSTANGTSSGAATVLGDAGAKFFGFYTKGKATLSTIIANGGGDDLAVGEFGISK